MSRIFYISSNHKWIKFILIFTMIFFMFSCALLNVFKAKDSDKDGICDRKDKCPGTLSGVKVYATGCPVDTDKDSVPDYLDECPDTIGIVKLKGCPDKDGDDIPDKSDRCPDQKGLQALQGCPDKDNDGIADIDDVCPDIKGLSEFKGCPDTDGDGITDKDDKCPDVMGVASNNGCPEAKAVSFDMEKVYLPISLPSPSALTNLPKNFFSNCQSYDDVNEKLKTVLSSCGYDDFRYYLIKNNGFALQTQLEQINDEGYPLIEHLRWRIKVKPLFYEGFSIRKFLQAIITESTGHYRFFLFIITPGITTINSDKERIYDYELMDVVDYYYSGMTNLPREIAKKHISGSALNYQVFVFHFVNHEITYDAKLIRKDPITAKKHLIQTGIWELLIKK